LIFTLYCALEPHIPTKVLHEHAAAPSPYFLVI